VLVYDGGKHCEYGVFNDIKPTTAGLMHLLYIAKQTGTAANPGTPEHCCWVAKLSSWAKILASMK
jgi:hypothetical protein